jgi:hypothetical protein
MSDTPITPEDLSIYTNEFLIWNTMLDMCLDPRHEFFRGKGAKGELRNVRVCEEWLTSFANFYRDMGPIPSPDYALDVLDEYADFDKNNCSWTPSCLSPYGITL